MHSICFLSKHLQGMESVVSWSVLTVVHLYISLALNMLFILEGGLKIRSYFYLWSYASVTMPQWSHL